MLEKLKALSKILQGCVLCPVLIIWMLEWSKLSDNEKLEGPASTLQSRSRIQKDLDSWVVDNRVGFSLDKCDTPRDE